MVEKNVQTNIILPEKLWNRAKARAVRDGRSFAEVVRRALTKYLMTREGGEISGGPKNPKKKGEERMSMLVKVVYSLSEKGRIEAVKRDLSAQKNQEKYFEDPEKRTLGLQGFYVDEKGTPTVQLKQWTKMIPEISSEMKTIGWVSNWQNAVLDAPILTLDEVFQFCLDEEKRKRERDENPAAPGLEPGEPWELDESGNPVSIWKRKPDPKDLSQFTGMSDEQREEIERRRKDE